MRAASRFDIAGQDDPDTVDVGSENHAWRCWPSNRLHDPPRPEDPQADGVANRNLVARPSDRDRHARAGQAPATSSDYVRGVVEW